ncbi:MAG: hypothetical protein JJE45_01620 [Prolixibacteraceae bacterium]|nr:hypothetical protein [Prolixibacteraceae bacterium]
MKILFILQLLFLSCIVYAQQPQKKKNILYQGYVFTDDSIPVENAFIINYRTSKIITTNSSGYFKTLLHKGDSLMINHVSLTPKVIYFTSNVSETVKVYVTYRTYLLKVINKGEYEKQKKNVDKNTETIKKDIQKQIYIKNIQRTGNINPYDDKTNNPGITVPILQLNKVKKNETE